MRTPTIRPQVHFSTSKSSLRGNIAKAYVTSRYDVGGMLQRSTLTLSVYIRLTVSAEGVHSMELTKYFLSV
jgi:hypothetical protein